MCETTDWSIISCTVEEHQERSIMEMMKISMDSFLNGMEGPPCVNLSQALFVKFLSLCERCNQHVDIRSREVSFPSHMEFRNLEHLRS